MTAIADTGFLVAFLNSRDQHLATAAGFAEQVSAPVLTCEAVLTEAAYLLGDAGLVLDVLASGLVDVEFSVAANRTHLSAGFKDGADDPEALRYKATSLHDEAGWLIERIGEIYRVCGERLPSIAPITPEENDVKPLADRLKTPLEESFAIDTEGRPQGRILGTQAKVRVFSVQFIKGLEFESVFLVGIDRMAALAPELIDRLLYVGLTRARSFLAVTHAGEFPTELSHVINRFAVGDWKRLISQQVETPA